MTLCSCVLMLLLRCLYRYLLHLSTLQRIILPRVKISFFSFTLYPLLLHTVSSPPSHYILSFGDLSYTCSFNHGPCDDSRAVSLIKISFLESLITTNYSFLPDPTDGKKKHECVLHHFSCVQCFLTLWTVAFQAHLSMGFPRQVYWSGMLCPPPGSIPDPGIELLSLTSPALTGAFVTTCATPIKYILN